jgi:hypothetical protein
MKRYRGQQADDEKPIGGGKFNKESIGHEAFNFLPIKNKILGYFQPQLQPPDRRDRHPSSIRLERIEDGFSGETLDNVLVIFLARNPTLGGQRIVGWYKKAVVHRQAKSSDAKERNGFDYFIETDAKNATLVPEPRRSFLIPGGKGGIGEANVCYALDTHGKRKAGSDWMDSAVEYADSYDQEDVVKHPEAETDPEIAAIIGSTIERSAGFQSNPRIRAAIEKYAMDWAFRRLTDERLNPQDVHTKKSYDFLCEAAGTELYVEVKGTQDSGKSISLTPKEVQHAKDHKNSALFIVHSVKVSGKRSPKVSGGVELFLRSWDISEGTLEPRGYVFKLPESAFSLKKEARAGSK